MCTLFGFLLQFKKQLCNEDRLSAAETSAAESVFITKSFDLQKKLRGYILVAVTHPKTPQYMNCGHADPMWQI